MLVGPGNYFKGTGADLIRARALFGVGSLLLILTLLVFLSAAANPDGSREAQEAFLERIQADPTLLPEAGIPFSSLFFGVYWSLLLALVGPVRYLMLRILGEKEPALSLAYYISLHGAIPMLLVGALIAMTGNLFPPGLPTPGDTGLTRVVLTAIVSIGGLLWEVFISSSGFRVHYAQNWGRAVLTALVPWLVLFQILVLA